MPDPTNVDAWLWKNGFKVVPIERDKPDLAAERDIISGVMIPPADDGRLDPSNR